MDKRSMAVAEAVEEILMNGAYKVTKYLEDKLTVKATLKRYQGKILKSRKAADIILTIGPPNYEEREKIKRAKKLGQGPIEMTVKYPPKGKR
jgi:Ni,Fe-hydrogenase III small subunit